MNTPLLGKELNKKHRVNDDIFTPEEIVKNGLEYVPAFPYETEDGETIEGGFRKVKWKFDHAWPDDMKEDAKKKIVEELTNNGWFFIRKVCLTPFADDMDYSMYSYNIGVLVSCGKRKLTENKL